MENGNKGPMNLDVVDYVRREKMALLNLTEQERRFCEGYVRHFDKMVAYRDAGYATQGFSGEPIKNLEEDVDALVMKPNVSVYLVLLRESVASRIGVDLDMIVEEYRRMAFANMGQYVSWDADGITFLQSSEQLTEAQRAGVMEITETENKQGKTVKVKLFPKQAALDRLFEILKELEDRQEKPKVNKIDNMQVNVILGDPVKRRAIEHLAAGMFNRQIMLVADDKDAESFNKHIENITKKFQGVARGSRGGGTRAFEAYTPAESAGSGRGRKNKGADGGVEAAKDGFGILDGIPTDKGRGIAGNNKAGVGEETGGENIGDTEISESGRYPDIPGL